MCFISPTIGGMQSVCARRSSVCPDRTRLCSCWRALRRDGRRWSCLGVPEVTPTENLGSKNWGQTLEQRSKLAIFELGRECLEESKPDSVLDGHLSLISCETSRISV